MSGTVSVKLLDGDTKLIPSIFLSVFHAASFVALTFCKKKIEISLTCALRSDVGTVLISLIGILYYKEAATMLKISIIFLIIAGAVGLKSAAIPNNASRRKCQRHLGTSQIVLWRKAPAYQQ
ncbi:MAG: SMR family transporter [Pseudomonadota bacterium]|nr:SMR family transporter [Pseudomonadota bacterium]